jgi:hypothetical protein
MELEEMVSQEDAKEELSIWGSAFCFVTSCKFFLYHALLSIPGIARGTRALGALASSPAREWGVYGKPLTTPSLACSFAVPTRTSALPGKTDVDVDAPGKNFAARSLRGQKGAKHFLREFNLLDSLASLRSDAEFCGYSAGAVSPAW